MASSDRTQRSLRSGGNLNPLGPSSENPLYPTFSRGTPSQDRAMPSTEAGPQEQDDLDNTAMQEAMARQFSAWAQTNPALAMAAITGQWPSPQATPTSLSAPAFPSRYDTVDSATSIREEFPDPPLFEGNKDVWIPFRNRMVTKLRNDGDLYSSTQQRLDYWASRLGNKASRHLEPYYNEYGELRMKSEHELIDLLNLFYVNSNQRNDEIAEYDQLRMKHTDKFIEFFMIFWRLATSIGLVGQGTDLPFSFVQHELLRRLPRRLRDHQVYVNMEFSTIETLRDYYIRLDNYWHQTGR